MKTYDMTHHLRRLVFGGLLLAAAAAMGAYVGLKFAAMMGGIAL